MKHFILAIDQGTTSSRAMIYNEKFEVLASHSQAFSQYYPKADRVEHDLEEIWESVKTSIHGALKRMSELYPDFSAEKISCIGVTNQRETFGLWNRDTSKPVAPAIVWQDRRSAPLCEKLRKNSSGKKLSKITGLVMDPYFSGTKLAWFFQENPKIYKEARKGNLAFGTMDSFLIWKLTSGGVHAIETSNASRTLLMDLKQREWSSEALKVLKIPANVLPTITDSDGFFGVTQDLDILPNNIPITGVLGDQQAALFGQEAFRPGGIKCTFGTGAFLLVNTGKKICRSKNSLSTVAWTLKGETSYALEASVFIAGAAVQWLRDNLGIIEQSKDVENLALEVEDSDGVFFVPALAGLGAPYWFPQAKGLLGGLSRRSTRAHIARAVLEGIASSVGDVFEDLVKDSGQRVKDLKVDGGAVANKLLLQLQADAVQVSISKPKDLESTVRGAAYMAALGAGLIRSTKELEQLNPIELKVLPKKSKQEAKRQREIWRRRIQGLMSGAY